MTCSLFQISSTWNSTVGFKFMWDIQRAIIPYKITLAFLLFVFSLILEVNSLWQCRRCAPPNLPRTDMDAVAFSCLSIRLHLKKINANWSLNTKTWAEFNFKRRRNFQDFASPLLSLVASITEKEILITSKPQMDRTVWFCLRHTHMGSSGVCLAAEPLFTFKRLMACVVCQGTIHHGMMS